MTIRAVIFDRDDTLVHYEPAAVAAAQAHIAKIAPSIPGGDTSEHWITWPGPWPRTEAEEPAFWRAYWMYICAHYQISETAAAELQEVGAIYHTFFTAFPDSQRCLRMLRERGLRLAVLTNFSLPSVHLTLRHAGLEPAWFTALLSSAVIGVRKPDPDAYLAAAAALDLDPSECAFVDNLLVNVEAACALGMQGILLDRQQAIEAGTIARIHDLDGLLDLLDPFLQN